MANPDNLNSVLGMMILVYMAYIGIALWYSRRRGQKRESQRASMREHSRQH